MRWRSQTLQRFNQAYWHEYHWVENHWMRRAYDREHFDETDWWEHFNEINRNISESLTTDDRHQENSSH
jgi:hypothetical protein